MAADYVYSPGLVLDELTLLPDPVLTGIFAATEGGGAQPIYDTAGTPIAQLTSNSSGYVASFRADISSGFVNFGSIWIPVVANIAQASVADAIAAAASATASATAAATSAASAAASSSATSGDPADYTYYVAKWGSDSNNGLSAARPLLTFNAAVAKQPPVDGSESPARRSTKIVMGPGDYTITAAVFNKARNLEIVGSGGRAGAKAGSRGGTNLLTPVGATGITIGFRDDADTSWQNSGHGPTLRNLHIRPAAADTGSSVGLKIIGMTNYKLDNVTIADYEGTGSTELWMQSNSIANGGSSTATMYGSFQDVTLSKGKTGVHLDGCIARLYGVTIDGNDDITSSYLAGSTGVKCTNGGGITGFAPYIQSVETAVDQTQSHGAGVLLFCQLYGLRMEACKYGVRSNQLGTAIYGGSFFSGNLSAGITGTIAFDMQAGAEFIIDGVSMESGVETRIAVASGASGYERSANKASTYYGTKLRGASGGKYGGLTHATPSTPTGTIGGNAGTGATFGTFTTGSTDMVGQFTLTTGTSPAAGTYATITFANAFPGGAVPRVRLDRVGTTNNNVMLLGSVSNTAFTVVFTAALTASTLYTIQYSVEAVLG